MNITATKIDTANVSITATIDNADIEKKIEKIAKKLSKTAKVDGFRKGKVPIAVIKQMYGEQLKQEAEQEVIQDVIEKAKEEADINTEDIIGNPTFKKFDKTDSGIEVEITISLKPTIEAEGYDKLAPKYDEPTVEESEFEERLDKLLEANTPYKKLKKDRGLKDGDKAVIDFVGKIDGEVFDGGKGEGFELVIGSGQFIPGFEDQMIGMKKGETKDITVTFPKDYQAKDLAGKEAVFSVTLHDIKVRKKAKLDEEMIKRLIPNDEEATADTVKERINEQIKREKIQKLYQEELKPKLMEALIAEYNFDLPQNIVEQEIDMQVSQKAQQMSKKELEKYKGDNEKINELRESVREDAEKSVKATFIVDALARKERIEVSDNEVSQTIYYEAIISGQDPQSVIEYYQQNNLLPAIKMGIIEDKLFTKIIGLDK